MNIGILTPGFNHDVDEWSLPFVQNMVTELSHHDDVRVISLRYPHTREPYRIGKVKVYPLGYGADARRLKRTQIWADAVGRIANLHREKPFDVLHAMWADETGLITAWAGKLLGIPTVVSILGGELVCIPEINYGSQCSHFGRWIVGQALSADAVIVTGSHSRGLLTKRYDIPEEKIQTIVAGIDTDTFKPKNEYNKPERLIHVGSLVGIKNQELLLRAVARLETIELDIIGDGVLRPKLEKLAYEMGILNRVNFAGAVQHLKMPAYYQNASLHIITSHNEGVPFATLEAAACRVPTISTQVGVLVDYPEMGVTVDKDDVELAKGINGLLRDDERREALSQSAYETVQANFTLRKAGDKFRKLYAELQR